MPQGMHEDSRYPALGRSSTSCSSIEPRVKGIRAARIGSRPIPGRILDMKTLLVATALFLAGAFALAAEWTGPAEKRAGPDFDRMAVDARELLRELVEANTTNPPGDE